MLVFNELLFNELLWRFFFPDFSRKENIKLLKISSCSSELEEEWINRSNELWDAYCDGLISSDQREDMEYSLYKDYSEEVERAYDQRRPRMVWFI